MKLEMESEQLRQLGNPWPPLPRPRFHQRWERGSHCFPLVCVLGCCRRQRSADRSSGGGGRHRPAADGRVRPRVRLQAPSEHRHAKRRQHHPQTDCKSIKAGLLCLLPLVVLRPDHTPSISILVDLLFLLKQKMDHKVYINPCLSDYFSDFYWFSLSLILLHASGPCSELQMIRLK